ncbi:MAG TPA: extracellular solute-binding protein [Bacillota bacterium]|nr:extracellular solute-binding protein [Bacillota bacterium]
MRLRRVLPILFAAAILAGCGATAPATPAKPAAPTASAAPASGTVSVLYAGSLVNMMEHQLGPAFAKASGYGFQGYGGGSSAVANEIKGKLRRGDVFISASPAVNDTLMGAGGGGWVSWYLTFAQAPVVIGYNPQSKFAADLKAKPWAQALAEPGIQVGSTDPKLDPKGKLVADLLSKDAQAVKPQVFPEQELIGRLQSGQLDAGFFYANEAAEAKIPTIRLDRAPSASYTVTTLANGPNPAGALAFVRFLLGPQGQALLKADGLTVIVPPQPTGAVPAGLGG